MPVGLPFEDRRDAALQLAEKLQAYKGHSGVVILALVRGGVEIGSSLADALNLPLYPYVVRKLGHPSHREYGLGAIAEGGATYLDEPAMQMSDVTWEDMEPIIEEEMEEMKRRRAAYLVDARPSLEGKTIILTDDGAATGGTMFAAIRDVRNAKAKEIIVALPVCPPDTAAQLQKRADKLIVLATPEPFDAVGAWYLNFPQLTDEDVLRLLHAKEKVR